MNNGHVCRRDHASSSQFFPAPGSIGRERGQKGPLITENKKMKSASSFLTSETSVCASVFCERLFILQVEESVADTDISLLK